MTVVKRLSGADHLSRRDFLGGAAAMGWSSAIGRSLARAAEPGGPAPATTLIVPAKAGAPVRFAAAELQAYLEKLTGIRPPLADDHAEVNGSRIILTAPKAPNRQAASLLPDKELPAREMDEFHLRCDGKTLVIAGGCDRAVLFGAYEFLERLGCRWLGPLEEFVPAQKPLTLPVLKVTSAPALTWRGLELISGSDPAVVDWMAKAKLNVAWPEKYVPKLDLTVAEESMKAAAIPEMKERGLTIFWGGHVLPLLFSAERYANHPEYFAEIKGKRLDPAVKDLQSRWQLCTSKPEVIQLLARNTITFLRHHPWIDVLFLWANDTNQWCECARCRALEKEPDKASPFGGLDRSASYCRLVKLVNEEVRKALPGRRLAFNHYYNLEDVPADLSVLPDGGVLSAVDAYRQCDRHAFTDAACPAGKRIEPIARAWGRHYKDSVNWTYYWSWNFMKGLPLPMMHKIAADFRFLKSLGVNGNVDNVSIQPSTLGLYDKRPGINVVDHWRYQLLNFHVYAKAAWEPAGTVDAWIADWLKHYYGPAAEPMSRFWKLLEEAAVQFGRDPAFMPEDKKLADPKVVHTWLLNIRYLIPNQRVFEELEGHLHRARHRAAAAYDQPLKAEYMPYLDRVQLLERALAGWKSTSSDFRYLHK